MMGWGVLRLFQGKLHDLNYWHGRVFAPFPCGRGIDPLRCNQTWAILIEGADRATPWARPLWL
jgi:hypothetical protein